MPNLGDAPPNINLSRICLSVCVCVCLLCFCYQGNTPKNLSKIKSELHETFLVCQDCSPELINHVCACAGEHLNPQRVKTWTLLLCLFCKIFGQFVVRFLTFSSISLLKMKNKGHTKKKYQQVTTFLFY